jgi:hypothetical protein
MKPKQIPRYLFRFRSNYKFYIKEIAEQYTWLSNVENLNDPIEGYFVRRKFIHRIMFNRPGKIDGLISNFQIHNNQELHPYICITHDHSDSLQKITVRGKIRRLISNINDRNQFLSKIKIACFTPDIHNTLMWIHYADNFKGICIGYHKSDIEEILSQDLILSKINYIKNPPTKIHLDDQYSFLGVKSKQWQYENEFRIIKNTESNKLELPIAYLIVGFKNKHIKKINFLSRKILNQSIFIALPCEETGKTLLVSYEIFMQEKKVNFPNSF